MSAREWKPGDVALVKFAWQTSSEPLVCMRAEKDGALGWLHPTRLGGFSSDNAPAGPTKVHPLVVIDPEDREQVEAIARAAHEVEFIAKWRDLHEDTRAAQIDALQAALRSLIEPPRPPEPQGLGAVVEDAAGDRWVRSHTQFKDRAWTRPHLSGTYNYDEVPAVRVLSEGVS